ncbi:MAG: gliding motility-associated C-terminal domain-containing protein [Bacteroidales bacterium]
MSRKSTIVAIYTLILLSINSLFAQEEMERVSALAMATLKLGNADNDLSAPSGEEKIFYATAMEEYDSPVAIEGSAPMELELVAICNYPTAQNYTWEISRDADYMNIEAQFTQTLSDTISSPLRYPFDQSGIYYVRLIVSNSDNSDETMTNSFKIEISESKLEVPNAFSPGNDGINDIFKVAYQSIVRFRGNIFNRWGVKLFQWEDPSEGWDGEYNGKLVNTGVYFYLIEAEGSDGKKYKLKGDINLFREK